MNFDLNHPARRSHRLILRLGLAAGFMALASSISSSRGESPAATAAAPRSATLGSYSLADYLDIVMARSPGVQSAILRAKAADYKATSVRLSYLPKLDAVGQTGYIDGTGITPLQDLSASQPKGASGYVDGYGGNLNIPLYSEGTFLSINTPPKAEIYDAIRNQEEDAVLMTRDEIRLQSIEAYFLAVEDAKKGELIGREVRILNQLAHIAEIQYHHQMISEAEFENSKLLLDQAAQDFQQAQWETENAFVVVASLLGVADATTVHLPARSPVPKTLPSFQVVLSHVLQSNPALLQQFAILQQDKAQHALDVSKFGPTVTSNSSYATAASNYGPADRYQILSLIQVSLPIFDGGENYYDVRSASSLVDAQKAQLYQTKLDLESELHRTYESAESLRRTYLQDELAAGQKEILVRQDFELSQQGQVPLPDYLNAQMNYINAAVTAEESYYAMMAAYAQLDKAGDYAGAMPILGSRFPE